MQINGKITSKILGLLASGKLDQNAINPGRPASPSKPKALPKNVQGQKLGGRHRGSKK